MDTSHSQLHSENVPIWKVWFLRAKKTEFQSVDQCFGKLVISDKTFKFFFFFFYLLWKETKFESTGHGDICQSKLFSLSVSQVSC